VQRDVGAALALERKGHIKTLLAVLAEQCRIPTLLQGYPVLQRPGGEAVSVAEGVTTTVQAILPASAPVSLQPSEPSVHTQPTVQTPEALSTRRATAFLPKRLADLGFTLHDEGGVEYIRPPLCTVPAGQPFLMGSDPEKDGHAFYL